MQILTRKARRNVSGTGRFGILVTGLIAATSCVNSATGPDLPVLETDADNQLGLTFSPDARTAFWVGWNGGWGSRDASPKRIYVSRLVDGQWGAPASAGFSGVYSDDDPFVSPDGRWLYFVSDRPTNDGDTESDTNIWRYDLLERDWLEQDRLEVVPVNSDAEEYSPVVTTSGNLYFASDRNGGPGQGDLYQAAASGDSFSAPEALGSQFNTPTGEWNLWVSADETDILFEASSRPTNVSVPGDLYYSWRVGAEWSPAIAVSQLNTSDSDLMPRLHPDGETLYYTSAPIGGHARLVRTNWKVLRKELRTSICKDVTEPVGDGTHRCNE